MANTGTIVVTGQGRYGNIAVVPRITQAVVTGTIVGIAGGNAYSIGVSDATGIYTGDTVRFKGTTSEYTVASLTGTLINLTGPFDVGYANVNDTITFIGNQYPRNFHNTGTFVSTSSFTASMYNNIVNITNKTYTFDYSYQLPVVATMSDIKSVDEYGTLPIGSVYNLKGSVYAEEHGLQVAYADPDGINTNTFQVNVSTTISNTSSNDLVTIDIAHQWLPAGSIIMWTKPQYKIPYGWWLCDGTTTPNGMPTPDLRNKFVIGADSELNDVPTITDRRNAQVTEGGSASGVLLPHKHSGTATTFAVYDPGHSHLAVGPNTTSPLPNPANDIKGPYDPSPQQKIFWGFTTENTAIASQWLTGGERIFQDLWGNSPSSNSGVELETRITVQSTGTDRTYSNLPQYKSLYFIFKWLTPATADMGRMYALPSDRGFLLRYYCVQTTKWGVYTDGSGGTYDQIIQINSADCGYIPPPLQGTLLSTHCVGYDKHGTYANGTGGTYDQLIETNSADCGYIESVSANLLLIGGGGGGFDDAGGGGGGGGSSYGNITLNVGTSYSVVVGAGGARNSSGGDSYVSGSSMIAHGGASGGTVFGGPSAGGTASGGAYNVTGGSGGAGARGGCNTGSPGSSSGLATSAGGGGGEVDYNDGTPTQGGAGGGGYAGAGGLGSGWNVANNTNGDLHGGGGGGGKNYGGAGAAGGGGVAVITYTSPRRLFNGGETTSSGNSWTHLFSASGTLS